jgi:tetratricopeptide (TPR) repeat protein
VVRLTRKGALALLLAAALVVAGCGGGVDGGEDAGTAGAALILPDDAQGPEVTSLIGVPLYRPVLPDDRRAELQANLDAAAAAYRAAPDDEESIIWYGRRLAYLSRYNDAIAVYSRGLELHEGSYKLLRHRGHRYITTRQLDAAVADLQRAAELAADAPVEIEPDGAPNALDIPLSNVHFNIWYHLALAHYLRGDFEAARDAWLTCMRYADNDDLLVATTDWLYMSHRRLGEDAEAAALLEPISGDMEIIENDSYLRRLLMYKGEIAPEELLDLRAESDPDIALNIATQGYGVGNWYLVNGDEQAARDVFERIVEGTSWAAFGYIAAEAELARGVGTER